MLLYLNLPGQNWVKLKSQLFLLYLKQCSNKDRWHMVRAFFRYVTRCSPIDFVSQKRMQVSAFVVAIYLIHNRKNLSVLLMAEVLSSPMNSSRQHGHDLFCVFHGDIQVSIQSLWKTCLQFGLQDQTTFSPHAKEFWHMAQSSDTTLTPLDFAWLSSLLLPDSGISQHLNSFPLFTYFLIGCSSSFDNS